MQTERLRAFGIPTLDDAGAVMLSSWLQGAQTMFETNFETNFGTNCVISLRGLPLLGNLELG